MTSKAIKHEATYEAAVLRDYQGNILYMATLPEHPVRRVVYEDDTVEIFDTFTGKVIAGPYQIFPEDD